MCAVRALTHDQLVARRGRRRHRKKTEKRSVGRDRNGNTVDRQRRVPVADRAKDEIRITNGDRLVRLGIHDLRRERTGDERNRRKRRRRSRRNATLDRCDPRRRYARGRPSRFGFWNGSRWCLWRLAARDDEPEREAMARGPHAGKNVGPNKAKTLVRSGVQFIDHVVAVGLYSRSMDVFPPEAHA